MSITLGLPNDLETWDKLQCSVKCHLQTQNILQWDNIYPTRESGLRDLQNGTLYVIKDTERILACLTIDQEFPEEYHKLTWNLMGPVASCHRLMVAPDQQKQGFGKQLMSFAETIALQQGCQSIRLDAYAANVAANALYNSLGYHFVGTLQFRTGLFNCYEKSTISNIRLMR